MVESNTSSRRRSRGGNDGSRASALERLKALREGRRSEIGFQIKVEDPVYDTVAEEDYEALVAKRRETAKEFIVDDDGHGYKDEGEEEDWTSAYHPSSSDDEACEDRLKRQKSLGNNMKDPQQRKPSAAAASLSAAAALMGKQRLSSMFTSSILKKRGDDRIKGTAAESIVDDVIAEFAPDESDRERRRHALPPLAKLQAPVALPKPQVAPDFKQPIVKQELLVTVKTENISERSLISLKDKPVDRDSHTTLGSNVEVIQNLERPSSVPEEFTAPEGSVVNEPKSKNKKEFVLNAKIEPADNSLPSGSAAMNDVFHKDSKHCDAAEGVDALKLENTETLDISLESDGSLSFYLIDAHEEVTSANLGSLYLFGKVKAGSAYHSCCVVVKNMQRCMYAIPNGSVFRKMAIAELERDHMNSKISSSVFHEKLQEFASELKNEIKQILLDMDVSTFTMSPVKRSYAFELVDIPAGEQYVLKVNYPYKDPPPPSSIKGKHFISMLGTSNSALELFLVKRKVKGPTWLSISNFLSCAASQRVSWCKQEIVVEFPKAIRVLTSSEIVLDIPPVVVSALNIKTIINEKNNMHEIVSASIICCHKAKIDTPMLASEWKKPGLLSHYTVVRKLEGDIFPMGFLKEVTDRNAKAGCSVLGVESSERALLNRLMAELHKLDSDVLVGHNISGYDLDVLLHRAQACKVPSSMWSKIGRLKRIVMPRLSKGGSLFGSGASLGIMSCIAGRLLCDTYLCSRELLKEVSFSLTYLAKTQLNKDKKDVAPHDIPAMFQESESLLQLVECGETDAWLSLELLFHLSILPLTRQLTNISGNLWSKTLQGARAQRVEYLLLHEFHAKKYIIPDKFSARVKENLPKRKITHNSESGNVDETGIDVCFENDGPHVDQVKGKRGPAYSGGLVLEPKKGLYDKYILLLDFNSLYPSIIQEYNICFTTVERQPDGVIPSLPSSRAIGVLPKLLKILVERRRKVKEWLKTATGIKGQQLDIQQQALKLTANSIYGCLGFFNSRFYAKPLAELITLQGREILQNTVELVQSNLNLEVIYGDTDSIMVHTGLDDIAKAKTMAAKIMQEVNKKYHCLEIDLDGLYKRMLLLKKKKYAAVKVTYKDGKPYEVIERKGLDMVRRDWSFLSKELGDFCLRQILSGGCCEDVVDSIHSALRQIQEGMKSGEVAIEKYIIMKTLTKPPEEYPDAKNQPHVQVALRMKQNGYATGCSAGDTVPYIICCQQDLPTDSSIGIAQRARHPDELKKDNGEWMIDIHYYLSQQIHPVVSRLCAYIQGTSAARLAECLGLDSSKFQHTTTETVSKESSSDMMGITDDEERYRGCEPLCLSCPSCTRTFDCPSVASTVLKSSNDFTRSEEMELKENFWIKLRCPSCPENADGARISPIMLANQAKRQAEKFVSKYYTGSMMCDDEMCKYTTRALNLRLVGDSERGIVCPNYPRCNGRLVAQYSEEDLYRQLSYFYYILDAARCLEKMEHGNKIMYEENIARIRPVVDLAASAMQMIRDRCAYGWVQLKDLGVSV